MFSENILNEYETQTISLYSRYSLAKTKLNEISLRKRFWNVYD